MQINASWSEHPISWSRCMHPPPPQTFSSYEHKFEKWIKLAQDSIRAVTFPILLLETPVTLMKFRKNSNDCTFNPSNLIMCENPHQSIFFFSMTPLHNTMKFWSMISHTSNRKSDVFLPIKTWPWSPLSHL